MTQNISKGAIPLSLSMALLFTCAHGYTETDTESVTPNEPIVVPTQLNGNTATAQQSQFDAYGCAPNTNESGPEELHTVPLPGPGLLRVRLDASDAKDVDVHILASAVPEQCLSRGDTAAAAFLSGTQAVIAVDTYNGRHNAGPYTLTLEFTPSASLEAAGVHTDVARRALHAYGLVWSENPRVSPKLTVIDFAVPATEKRLWVFDVDTMDTLFHLHVTHGSNTAALDDYNRAATFSNIEGTHQSSLGLMKTGETYYGMWGYSLKLDGLDPEFNSEVRPRHVVIHGADCANEAYVQKTGSLCLSWGCPTVGSDVSRALIDTIKGGTTVWSDFPDQRFLKHSKHVHR